jgi:hypothetical protein
MIQIARDRMTDEEIRQRQAEVNATVTANHAASVGLLGESIIPLAGAADLFKRPDGRKPSRISTWRWATRGVRCRRLGLRVRLETMIVGSTRYTSLQAIRRFSEALDDSRAANVISASRALALLEHKRHRQRRRQLKQVKADLKAGGFMD